MKKKYLLLVCIISLISFSIFSLASVHAVVNPHLEVGEILVYQSSLKVTLEGKSASGTAFTKYEITTINSSALNVDDVYADVYTSEYSATSFSAPDQYDTHIGTIQNEFYIGEMFYPPSYEFPDDVSIVKNNLRDKLSGIELDESVSITKANLLKFRSIWFNSGYKTKIFVQTSNWDEYNSLWHETYRYNFSLTLEDKTFYSSSGILLKSKSSVDADLNVRTTSDIPQFPIYYDSSSFKIKIETKILSEYSTPIGIDEHPWYGRNAAVTGIVLVNIGLASWLGYKGYNLAKRKKELHAKELVMEEPPDPVNSNDEFTDYIVCSKCGRKNKKIAHYCMDCGYLL